MNEDFCKIAGYSLEELVGKPHNIVRHPEMPKKPFKSLWDTIQKGEIWTGYVKNATKDGGYYWVFATVYPLRGSDGSKGIYLVEETNKPRNRKNPKSFMTNGIKKR